MWLRILTVVCVVLAVSGQAPLPSAHTNKEEQRAAEFIKNAENMLEEEAVKRTFAEWNYESNIKEETKKKSLDAQQSYDQLSQRLGKEANKFKRGQIKDEEVLRKLEMLRVVGTAALPEDKLVKFNKLTSDMAETYSTAKVKGYKDKSRLNSLEPELTEVMARSRDPKELKYYWENWREQSGRQIREMYKRYVSYYNEAAKINGFRDASLMKVHPYESDTFMEEMEATWQGLKPLYQQLHAFVRHKLHDYYGPNVVSKNGPIPAHLLVSAITRQGFAESLVECKS